MMAGLFLVFTLALIAIYLKKRTWAIGLITLGFILSVLMFCHHATDVLQINW